MNPAQSTDFLHLKRTIIIMKIMIIRINTKKKKIKKRFLYVPVVAFGRNGDAGSTGVQQNRLHHGSRGGITVFYVSYRHVVRTILAWCIKEHKRFEFCRWFDGLKLYVLNSVTNRRPRVDGVPGQARFSIPLKKYNVFFFFFYQYLFGDNI